MQLDSNSRIVIAYKDLLGQPYRVMNWTNIQKSRTCYFGQHGTSKVQIKSNLLHKNYFNSRPQQNYS